MTRSLPATVVAASGFDAMSHALESLTAIAYPRPPAAPHCSRPPSQGANPLGDALATEALKSVGKYLVRAVRDAADTEARTEMMYAATLPASPSATPAAIFRTACRTQCRAW